MKGSDGKLVAPTNERFHIEFCTVAHWKNGEIVEENLFYDLVGLLKQIGVMWGVLSASCASFICSSFQDPLGVLQQVGAQASAWLDLPSRRVAGGV
jgi:hypothetical protein